MTTEGEHFCQACGVTVRMELPTKYVSINAARINGRGAYFGPVGVHLTADVPLCSEHFKKAMAAGAAS